ncbi:MSHA biogenesis protein MshQ [Vibrio parahaemolyticus]|nr:MSHA biogenesis protein MshQ [Vibrio parahaemolyticus]
MKTLNALLALMLMLPSFVYASQCSVKGQDNFTVSFDVEGDDEYQAVKLKQGSHGYVLWYTGYKRNNTNNYDYLFNEQQLINDVDYNIQITHEAGSNTLKYYRKFEGAANYKLIETQTVNLDNGQYWVVDVGDDVDNIQCSNTVDPGNPGGPINRSPDFEFGTVDNSTCSMTGGKYTCTIHFENTYDASHPKPLVFVMPTIDKTLSSKNPRKTEYPSSISVVHTTHNSATIVQEFPPHQKADRNVTFLDKNSSQVQKELAKVDYFVIEPGVLELNNGAKIVAGTIKTNVAASQYKNNNKGINEQNNGITIDFDDYGLTGFDGKPGVLVQPQTKNNDGINNWFTGMARDANTTSFKLALEKSEVYKKNNQGHETFNILSDNETVAFVAGEGFGYINGQRFWLGQGRTKYTLDQQDPVIDPIYEGCKVYTPFPNTAGFVSPPVLVANKNSRRGNNGGWLRRCDIKKDSVAFIVEEDMQKDRERGHLDEDVGWFMFEKANTNPMCNGFNSPVQTWKRPDGYIPVDDKDGELHLYGNPSIVGAPIVDGKRVLGFLPDHIYDRTLACSEQTCTSDEGLMTGQEALENFPNHLAESRTVLAGDTLILDDDNQTYESLSVGGTVIIKSGRYKIGKIDVWESGNVIVQSRNSVTIDTRSLAVNNRGYFGIEITNWANPQLPVLADADLRVNVHNITKSGDRTYVDLNSDAQFVGLLYSEKHVEMSGDATVYGSVSARSVQLTSTAKIQAATECIDPPTSYELTVTPTKQYALTCGEDQPSFIIETKNGTQSESTGVTVGVGPNERGLSVQVVDNVGSGSYPHFITSKSSSNLGKLKLSVMVTDNDKIELNKDYKLTVTLDNDSSKTLTSTFRFVPYKFDVQPQFVIAGQDSKIETKVLACQKDSQAVVKSYQGTPIVKWGIVIPAAGRKEESLFTYAPTFSDGSKGVTSGPFKVMESGVYTVTLTDTKFTCDPNYSSDCPIAPTGDDSSQSLETVLTGSFTVQSRPWKIAACNIVAKNGGKTNPATQATGDGFIASAESFNVTYKAIVHIDSGGNANNVCEYPLTQNYFSDSNTAAPLDAEFSVLYPSGGDIANLDSSKGSSLDFSSEEAKAGKTVEYVWNEVGSLNLKTKATYLGMELDEYDVTVGRFYPKYFKVVDSSWTYPESQSFAYMNQPFDAVEFSVEALNANKAAIKNYANFSTKAEFNLDDIEHYSGRFDAPDFGAGSWSNELDKSIGDFSISNSGQCIGSACWNKDLGGNYPDGPFNSVIGTDKSQIGLIYTYNVDPVEFITDGDSNSRLVKQPDIRFGRIDLDDVGGNQGSVLHVPLRVEYWNGSRFIANPNDNQTDVKGVTAAERHIWPTGADADPKAVTLGAGGEVSSGSSRSVTATQAEPYRQQTRVWLDLDDSTNGLPWLKYNWDNKNAGEENPSSVVTFGIHRGNDRVIYRGEPGLTGQ